MPRENLTKGQLLAVLMRIFEWKISNESGQPRWIEYYVKALALWMTNEINFIENVEEHQSLKNLFLGIIFN